MVPTAATANNTHHHIFLPMGKDGADLYATAVTMKIPKKEEVSTVGRPHRGGRSGGEPCYVGRIGIVRGKCRDP